MRVQWDNLGRALENAIHISNEEATMQLVRSL
jgi:hypothetical protein